jgi:beta-aspartyl-peptidase (threonine type)
MILHGGAGSGKYGREDRRFKELLSALEEGIAAMRRGSSLDGVVAAVKYMEECGAFNAGKGACLTAKRTIQLDAAVMEGEKRRGAGVGAVSCTSSPVSLARWLMENTGHILVVGDDCRPLARAAGLKIERLRASRERLERFEKMKSGKWGGNVGLWKRVEGAGTVGAVAVDSSGTPSAAVSTGGMWLKLPGRIGDSAIIGDGVYADSALGAACATGTGEEIIRNALAFNACEYMRSDGAHAAARRAIAMMTKRSGRDTAGIVTVDTKGRVGFAFNTDAMGRAWYDEQGRAKVQV